MAKITENNTKEINALTTNVAVILSEMTMVKTDVKDIKDKLDKEYATKEWVKSEFGTTKNTVNGILVTFGLAIISALATFVIRGGLK